MWYEAFWFVAGIILYSIISKLLNVGHSVIFFRKVQAQALVYLGLAAESIAFINAIKYNVMKDAEKPDDQIKMMKMVDKEIFDSWKQSTIVKINAALPRHLFNSLSMQDWKEVMKYLDEAYKKGQEKV